MPATTTAERLRRAGLRATAPRSAVVETLEAVRGTGDPHLTVADVAEQVRAALGAVSTQTVYDCLDALTAAGLVRRIEPAAHPALYEARVGDNHHHLVCRTCGQTVDVDCSHGSAPCLRPEEDRGFVVDEAEVIFWGTCAECRGGDLSRRAGEPTRRAGTRSAAGPAGARAPGGPAGARASTGPVGARQGNPDPEASPRTARSTG